MGCVDRLRCWAQLVALDSIAYRGFRGRRLRRNLHAKPRNRLRGLRGWVTRLRGFCGITRSYRVAQLRGEK
jgi:hypothetical protein